MGKFETSIKQKGKGMYNLSEQKKFKVGDKVVVTHRARDFENGWNNSWCNDMNKYVNREAVVQDFRGTSGIQLKIDIAFDEEFLFPYFCLELVEQKEESVTSCSIFDIFDKYPHTCEYCGAPSWNGIKLECSNDDCVTNKK